MISKQTKASFANMKLTELYASLSIDKLKLKVFARKYVYSSF